jgi:hypothetical protein
MKEGANITAKNAVRKKGFRANLLRRQPRFQARYGVQVPSKTQQTFMTFEGGTLGLAS